MNESGLSFVALALIIGQTLGKVFAFTNFADALRDKHRRQKMMDDQSLEVELGEEQKFDGAESSLVEKNPTSPSNPHNTLFFAIITVIFVSAASSFFLLLVKQCYTPTCLSRITPPTTTIVL